MLSATLSRGTTTVGLRGEGALTFAGLYGIPEADAAQALETFGGVEREQRTARPGLSALRPAPRHHHLREIALSLVAADETVLLPLHPAHLVEGAIADVESGHLP
ncbi:hypothetical protein [Actinocorallia aurea]